ncbi:hypothetical protein [Salmonirosea aquatica]|uniref:Uncharacterized protein n=1 Tax=Salmonirosea aquatica TaxID=2654236 RepID=A0A7C9BAI3_9BACT|nr:hypothetical protein [Cytophagaceae bacterium SJW1-29]
MKSFLQQNALRLFVGSLFILAVVLSMLLFRYANPTTPVPNLPGVTASDTIAGDITIKNLDSLQLIR